MKMAKAIKEDMKAALLLLGILEDVEAGEYPRDITGQEAENDPEHFDKDNFDHLKAFHQRVMHCINSRPSGIARVIWGFQTILDNNVLDTDVDHLELHPQLKLSADYRVNSYQIDGGTAEEEPIDVVLQRMPQIEGPDKWAILEKGAAFNRNGKWELESMPSRRDAEYLNRCRFTSPGEALATWSEKGGKSRFSHYRQQKKETPA